LIASMPIRDANRLPEHDYSTPGAYFVTVCCQNRNSVGEGLVPSRTSGDHKGRPYDANGNAFRRGAVSAPAAFGTGNPSPTENLDSRSGRE